MASDRFLNGDTQNTPSNNAPAPADEYEAAQRAERIRVELQIENDVITFFGLHLLTAIMTITGTAAAGTLSSIISSPVPMIIVPIAIITIGWLTCVGFAVRAAYLAIQHVQHLRWARLLLASVPWIVLGFESIIVIGILISPRF